MKTIKIIAGFRRYYSGTCVASKYEVEMNMKPWRALTDEERQQPSWAPHTGRLGDKV